MTETLQKNGTWVSWNENLKHPFKKLHKIDNEAALQSVIKTSKKVRFFGNKQSSADISAGVNTLIDIRNYNRVLHCDQVKKQITVQAGIKLVDLIESVEAKGWCIPCLPDINTVTLGGALATGTHGTSGYILAQYATKLRVIQPNGKIIEISDEDLLFDAYRVSLGVLGVISTVTFQCEPIYTLHVKEKPVKDSVWLKDLKEKVATNDFLRILWLPHTGFGYEITGNKIPHDKKIKTIKGPKHLKHRRATSVFLYKYTHIYPWFTSYANKILKLLFFSSKQEHKGSLYQSTVTKSRGATMELAEWTISIDKFHEVFTELKTTINSFKNNAFVHVPMDIRFLNKDNSWLSYAYDQNTVTVGCVTRNAATAEKYEVFEVIETIFLKHGGRPHWGKRFAAKNKELTKIYPKWEAFKKLRKEVDPTNKLLNPYLTTLFDEK